MMWSNSDYDKVFAKIASLEREMVEMQTKITAIPAISPASGGEGEAKKAALIAEMINRLSPDELNVYKAPDESAPSGDRPSIVARWLGENTDRTIWVMAHVDVVPPGPRELWDTDPYEVVEKDGKLYGRGVEDNQQALVAGFFAVKAMLECGLKPSYNVGLLFVADEEVGSKFGVDWLLKNHEIVNENDILLVPDTGSPDGSLIEIAEKSIVWLKCIVKGKQSHGSRPEQGNNALRSGAKLLLSLDRAFHEKWRDTDPLFDPSESTFEPTKKDANVENVNTIPGEDVFYFDCRLLPGVSIEDVEEIARVEADRIENEYGVNITFETPQRQKAAPPTSVESEVVQRLSRAIKETRDIEAKPVGIGGGTVAAFFREAGIPAAVWGTLEETMHQPNEYCIIANMVADAKVFAHMFGQE
ncbi:MAG: M20 family metallo-hydrolase [Planctomycetota bacterium]|jgi:succinyl-diaminopimelate desuccinylase